ncbi:protein of unknown function [Denitratisoma oestradiolicum]|uniref:Uncharacterized protein n=1 Tax=Denitratisoma oestradiolicum TaxID=311182 RepID=A0A6S6XV32_9PROT|nr:protein of unknown function [Denitratisoma oestradiolicum]
MPEKAAIIASQASRPALGPAQMPAFQSLVTVVPGNGLEPSGLAAADFKSAVFTNFTTRAIDFQ